MTQPPPAKVLIVLHGAIGDVVRALPLAVRLKRHWPLAKLYWAIEPKSLAIIENHPAVDQIILFDRPRGLKAFWDFTRRLKQERFDLVLDLQRHFKSGITSWSTGSPKRVGFNRSNAKEFNWLFNTDFIQAVPNFSPKVGHYQLFGDLLGFPVLEPLEFELKATEEERSKIETLIDGSLSAQVERRGYAAMILGSTWPSRFWRVDSYSRLIRELFERHSIVSILIGASSELKFAESIKNELGDAPIVDLVQQTSLRDLVAVFGLCSFAVGSDSGPMHIAAASGIPMVSLWGSTSPERSAPYGSEHLVVQADVDCSPCYKRECPGLGDICMKGISAESVLTLVEREIIPSL
jgi:lipopolysaccharide heptosyltransferase II